MTKAPLIAMLVSLMFQTGCRTTSSSKTKDVPSKDYTVAFLRSDFEKGKPISSKNATKVLQTTKQWRCRLAVAYNMASKEDEEGSMGAAISSIASRMSVNGVTLFSKTGDDFFIKMGSPEKSENEFYFSKLIFGKTAAYSSSEQTEEGKKYTSYIAFRSLDDRLILESSRRSTEVENPSNWSEAILGDAEAIPGSKLVAEAYGECR